MSVRIPGDLTLVSSKAASKTAQSVLWCCSRADQCASVERLRLHRVYNWLRMRQRMLTEPNLHTKSEGIKAFGKL